MQLLSHLKFWTTRPIFMKLRRIYAKEKQLTAIYVIYYKQI